MKTPLFLLLCVCEISQAREVSIKNHREIYESMKAQMSVTPKPGDELATAYESVQETLPTLGTVDEYNASMLWSLVRLASDFCRARITLDAKAEPAQRWLHKMVSFSKAPSFVPAKDVIQDYAQVFWQRTGTEKEAKEIEAFSEGLVMELPQTAAGTLSLLNALCTVMGTSTASVIIN